MVSPSAGESKSGMTAKVISPVLTLILKSPESVPERENVTVSPSASEALASTTTVLVETPSFTFVLATVSIGYILEKLKGGETAPWST